MERRKFTHILSILGIASLFSGASSSHASQTNETQKEELHGDMEKEERIIIGMLVYPGMYLQDLVGPLSVFEALMNKEIHLIWKNKQSVSGDNPASPALIPVTPTTAFAECPERLDVLFVPGGVPGTFTMMQDPEVLAFLSKKAESARYVTSVCTGSLILGAAGLLKGYKATSYWSLKDVLKEFGAIVTDGRVVVDRNRITGGGVTAGIDFALKITELLRGKLYAQTVQLYLEYDPQPPYDSGSPEKAPPAAKAFLVEMFQGMHDKALGIAKSIALKR